MSEFIYLYKLIYLRLLPSHILDFYCLVGRFEFYRAIINHLKTDDKNKMPLTSFS